MNSAINFYNEIFNHVNDIVENAIDYSRDSGDPYYNSSPKKLEASLVSLVRELNCFNDYMVTYLDEYKHIPKIMNRNEYYKITHPNGEIDF